MNPLSIDIKDMLEAESSLGLTYQENLFISREPTEPANCVTLYDTSNRGAQLTLDSQNYYYNAIQVRVRNVDYEDGYVLIHDIMEALHGRAQETVNGTLYSVIYSTNSPALLERDDNNRAIFICNFNLQRR